ncbi:WD repeat-containing protein 74 [Polyodon spathula]|uniref:WD repeat-containing protein 74 n=1 Tax=Polyodon spathula TaxID=7913 RepID=UPI001B7F6867|nr:WD repeat-containing protein 74 [Polyodon spathula]
MAESSRLCSVWVGSETGILKGVDLAKKQAFNYSDLSTLSRDQEVTALCWGDDFESEVLVGSVNRTVKTFSTEKSRFTEFRHCPGGEGPFRGLAVWNSSLITCVESGLLKVWKEGSLDSVEIPVGPDVYRMRQSPSQCHRVATGGKANDLKIWDLQRPEEPVFRAKNVRNDWLDLQVPVWIRDVQFIPGSDKVVTCTGYHQVRVYDPASPQRRPVLEVEYEEYPLTALSLTADANSVVVGNTHGQVAIIDLRQGRLLRCLKGFAGSVLSLQCHSSLPLVASCGLDRFLRVHNTQDRQLQHKVYLKSRLNCLLFSSQDKLQADGETALQDGVKEEDVEEEEDEVWADMPTVTDRAGGGKRRNESEGEPQRGAAPRRTGKTNSATQAKKTKGNTTGVTQGKKTKRKLRASS